MSGEISASIEIKSWDEKPFDEGADVAKLTTATVSKDYSGGITGTSVTESLMAYAPDGSASFVGIERITGSVAGKNGTLVLQHVGSYEGGAATGTLTVLSGTDELQGASGTGTFVADPDPRLTLDLD